MAQKDEQEGGFKVKPAGFEPARPHEQKPPPHAKDDDKGPPRHAQDDKPKKEKPAPKAGEAPEAEPLAYSRSIPDPVDPNKAYQNYMVSAISALYPNLRDGVDFVVGRREHGGDVEILHWSDKLAPADQGKVVEVAKQLATQDPYVDYQPKRGTHRGFAPPGTEGEVIPPREGERPGQVTPAEFAGRKEGSDQPDEPQPPRAA